MKKFAIQFTDWRWKDQYVVCTRGRQLWVYWTKDPQKAKHFDTFKDAQEYHDYQGFSNLLAIVEVNVTDYTAYDRAMSVI